MKAKFDGPVPCHGMCDYPHCLCYVEKKPTITDKLADFEETLGKPKQHDCNKEFVYSFDGGFCRVCGKRFD